MNGFTVAELVATKINNGVFAINPNATAMADPNRQPEEFNAAGTVITTVMWRGRRMENESKSTKVRVHTIDVAMQRRCKTANHVIDTTKFKALLDLADAVEGYLIANPITGVRRIQSFVGTEVPYILQHLTDHEIGTVIITIEYEEQIA